VSSKKGKKQSKDTEAKVTGKEEPKKAEKKQEKEGKQIEAVPQPENEKEEPTQIDILKDQLKESENQAGELEEKLLRVAADFDNFRKRVAREFENLTKFANENLIGRLTDTLDNFERALDHAKNSTDFDNFHKGIELIYESLREVLEKEGLKPIKTVGEKFDPNFHEAVSQRESDEYPEGVIVDEISKGYILNDRVIKAPKVIVSTGISKQEQKETEQRAAKEENSEDSQEKD
jgi:molecular chaperone GrpE